MNAFKNMETVHGGDVYDHPGILDFSANINPLGPPENVKKAVRESAEKIAAYPDVRKRGLLSALSKHTGIPEKRIVCGNGASELILMWALAVRPLRTLIAVPSFSEYEHAIRAAAGNTDRTETSLFSYYYADETHGFVIGEDFCDCIDARTNAVVLCNPGNPTGTLIPEPVLSRILDRCRDMHIPVLLDECFLDFCEDGDKKSIIPDSDSYPELTILRAFTKRYAMAGLRLGYCICGSEKMAEEMRCMTQPWNVSTTAQEAGTAALASENDNYLKETDVLIKTERTFLRHGFDKLGFRVYGSSANYVFFHGPQGLYPRMLKQGIMLRDCSNYRGLTDGWYRVAVRKHDDNEKLLEALGRVI